MQVGPSEYNADDMPEYSGYDLFDPFKPERPQGFQEVHQGDYEIWGLAFGDTNTLRERLMRLGIPHELESGVSEDRTPEIDEIINAMQQLVVKQRFGYSLYLQKFALSLRQFSHSPNEVDSAITTLIFSGLLVMDEVHQDLGEKITVRLSPDEHVENVWKGINRLRAVPVGNITDAIRKTAGILNAERRGTNKNPVTMVKNRLCKWLEPYMNVTNPYVDPYRFTVFHFLLSLFSDISDQDEFMKTQNFLGVLLKKYIVEIPRLSDGSAPTLALMLEQLASSEEFRAMLAISESEES